MSVQKLFLFAALLVNLTLGLLVFLKTRFRRKEHVFFSMLAWAAAGWIFAGLMTYLHKGDPLMVFWAKMSFSSAALIAYSFLCFALLFPGDRRTIGVKRFLAVTLPPLFFTVLSFTTNQIVSSIGVGSRMFHYGGFYPVFSAYLICYFALGFFYLVRTSRNAVGLERLQIKYVLLAMFATTATGITTNLFLPMMGISQLNWLGPTCTVIMVGGTTYSIIKHRLMDIDFILTKGTTYLFLVLLLFVPSTLLVILSQRLYFNRVDYHFTGIFVLLLIAVTFSFSRIKGRTERAVKQLLFRDRYDYLDTLAVFSKAMVTILDLESLSEKIIDTVTRTLGVEKASLYSMSEEKGGYHLLAAKNLSKDISPSLLPKNDPLPSYLAKLKEIVAREELTKGAHLRELREVTNQMSSLEAEVSIPLIAKGQLTGILNLSHKFNNETYSHQDLELLATLANQAAIAVENARLYEDLKRSKSYIRRADRLASLGTLTAGLAHEIRNPLVAIKTLTQLLPDRLEDEEFRNHFLQIASGEVDRISSLVNELLEFARPSEPKLEMEDLNSILDGMLLLVSTATKKKHIKLVKEYAPDLPPITIDREQIKQVFLNILLNAIDATPENGTITVKTRSFTKPGGEEFVQVEFQDNGCGIPAEYLEEIFTPFFTTKAKGSGLGLSISNQIVQDHRGYITVESELNRGSKFVINLPLNQEHPRRRKTDFEGTTSHTANPVEQ